MRQYELVMIFKPAVSAEQMEKFLAKLDALIAEAKGSVVKVDKQGKKILATPFKKFDQGIVVILWFESEPPVIARITETLRVTESVIRFLLVKSKHNVAEPVLDTTAVV